MMMVSEAPSKSTLIFSHSLWKFCLIFRLVRSGVGGEEATFKLPYIFHFSSSHKQTNDDGEEKKGIFYVAVGKCGRLLSLF